MKAKAVLPGLVGSLRALAAACGIDRNTLAKWRSQDGFPQPRDDGQWRVYDVGFWRGKRSAAPFDDEPLLAGGDGDSVYLEECRKHKSRSLKIEADLKEGSVVAVEKMQFMLAAASRWIREGIETLDRSHSREAADVMRHALNAFEREVISVFSADDACDDQTGN